VLSELVSPAGLVSVPVNCSNLSDLHCNGRKELCATAKRYGICYKLMFTHAQLPRLCCAESTSLSRCEHHISRHTVGKYTSSEHHISRHTVGKYTSSGFIHSASKAATDAAVQMMMNRIILLFHFAFLCTTFAVKCIHVKAVPHLLHVTGCLILLT